MFPPVKTLIVSPNNHHSFGAGISSTAGSLFDPVLYPLSNLVDGVAGPMCRWATTAAGVEISIGADADILGIINHNIDPNNLIQPYVNGSPLSRTFRAAYPNCWIDLRAFGTPGEWESLSVSSIGFTVAGNSRPIAIGEVVVGDSYRFDGTIKPVLQDSIAFPNIRNRTDAQVLLEMGLGTHVRAARLELMMSAVEAATLGNVSAFAGDAERRVIVVPNSRQNDIWLVRWPTVHATTFPDHPVEPVHASIDLIEEAPGILV